MPPRIVFQVNTAQHTSLSAAATMLVSINTVFACDVIDVSMRMQLISGAVHKARSTQATFKISFEQPNKKKLDLALSRNRASRAAV